MTMTTALTPEELDRIRELARAGLTFTAIVAVMEVDGFCVTYSQVRKQARKAGFPGRVRGNGAANFEVRA